MTPPPDANGQARTAPVPLLFGRRFARHLQFLGGTYWRSVDARRSALLLAGAVGLEIATVYAALRLSDAERRILDALQERSRAGFAEGLGVFAAIAIGFALIGAYRIYVRQLVEIRWRRGVTAHYLDRWLPHAYCQQQLHGDDVDNPDQRIAEDAREFVASALGLSLSLLSAVATLLLFGGLLWRVSRQWVWPWDGVAIQIPGALLWMTVLFAGASTGITHLIGRRLVPLNVDRLRYEADFRFGLMRFRDNAERVTLSHGAALERRSALARFADVMRNWWQLIAAQRQLTVVTGLIGQANGMIPLFVAAPGFFAGMISLGTVVQIRIAYGQVSGALNWFVYAYQEIARWRANVERLASFAESMDATDRDLQRNRLQIVRSAAPQLRLVGVRLRTGDGAPLLDAIDAVVAPGDRVAISGPSGSGKTVLLRAIAGMWPFGTGRIEVPAHCRMLFVPQWPYLPWDSLRTVMSYPALSGTISDRRIADAMRELGLDGLLGRLDERALWDQQLSPTEQQRLAIARVLLNEPEWVFLDNVTSTFDERTEQAAYELLLARLPRAAIVSVVRDAALNRFHHRLWAICRQDGSPGVLRMSALPSERPALAAESS